MQAPGRPRTAQEIVDVVLRMAEENPRWGYTRIRGALSNIGHEVGRTTIRRILSEHGVEPAPERRKRSSWATFLKAHWGGVVAAMDFFAVEVLTLRGLVRYFVLVVIRLESREIEVAGIVHQPYGVRSIKGECLDRIVPLGEKHLRDVVGEYIVHYHAERNHQGLGNRLVAPAAEVKRLEGAVRRRERVGGLLNYYYRDAA